MNTFSISAVFNRGWGLFKANKGFLIGTAFITFLISWLSGWLTTLAQADRPLSSVAAFVWLLYFAGLILSFLVSIGLIRISLKLLRGQKADFKDLFMNFDVYWKFILGSLLLGLIVSAVSWLGIGLGILISSQSQSIIWTAIIALVILVVLIVAIYLTITFQFFSYAIVDQKMGVIDSFRYSAKLTKGVKWQLIGVVALVAV